MKRSPADRADLHVSAQVAAASARLDATSRAGELAGALREQDRVFLGAMRELQAVRDFVGTPENILGRAATKHGEIAERVHVGVSRAWDVLHRRAPTATFDGVARTGPADYRVDGVDIQSKYYNGLRNTLDGVASHAEKYPGFPDGPGRYHIPRDQYGQLDELRRTGKIEGLSDRSARVLQGRVDDLGQSTSRPADELIEPGEASYAEVQRGRVHDTLRDRKDRLTQENEEIGRTARVEHGPSTAGFVKSVGLGGMVGGGVGLTQAVWIKYREGRSPFRGEFSIRDWQDVGVGGSAGAGGGAVAGGALYLLTNSTALAAPFAGSLVSGLMGIGALLRDHYAGTIDGEQFVEMSHIVAMDAAAVGLASAAGQTMIPVPLLGALLGGLAGKLVTTALQNGLGESESVLISRLAEYERYALGQLDEEFRAVMQGLDAWFGNLERLAATAFDPEANTELLMASVRVAEIAGVPEELILRTTADLDTFMQK